MQKVAILGAGYCGLALAWRLSDYAEVTVFDPLEVGKTSSASTGLMHPFLGTRPRLSWHGFESFATSLSFLQDLQKTTKTPIYRQTGVFKPILYDRQVPDFRKASQKYSEVEWVDSFQKKWNYPSMIDCSGIWIPMGISVHSRQYLVALQNQCLQKGVKRVYQKTSPQQALEKYDQVVLATGSFSHEFAELEPIAFDRVKGQALLCKWPEKLSPLPMSIIGQGHICMTSDNKHCFIGSTYEHEFDTEEPTDHPLHLPKQISGYLPIASDLQVLSITSGVRMYRKDSHLPIAMKVDDRIWAFTAIGSRGLLYHHYLAKYLSDAIRFNDSSILPTDVQIKRLMV